MRGKKLFTRAGWPFDAAVRSLPLGHGRPFDAAVRSLPLGHRRPFDAAVRSLPLGHRRLLGAFLLATLALWALMGAMHQSLGAEATCPGGQCQGLGKTIYVDGDRGSDGPGCGWGTGTLACKTIQEAATHRADDGDTVLVAAGTYRENLLVTRAITMQGGWNSDFDTWNPTLYTTVISGQPDLDTVTVSETVTLLDGLTVLRGDDGVRLGAGAGARLTHMVVYGQAEQGIETDGAWLSVSYTEIFSTAEEGILSNAGSGAVEIVSSTVHGTGQRGIYLRGSGPDTISGTLVYNTADDGIRMRGASAGSLINNRVYAVKGEGDGIQVDALAEVLVEGNTVYTVGKDGVRFDGSGRATLRDNRIYEAGDEGLQVEGSARVTVAGNLVYRTGADGILVQNAGGTALIQGNTVYSTTGVVADGIRVGQGVVATVRDNTVYNVTDDAIDFKGVSGLVEGNRLYAVGDVGVQISGTLSITVTHNEIHDTIQAGVEVRESGTAMTARLGYDTQGDGARVGSDSTVLIQGNTIYNVLGEAADGIHVGPRVAAEIVANTVYNATDDGIAFNGSIGRISENNLHDNGASGIDVDADAVTIAANRLFGNGLTGIELERAANFTVTNNLIGENWAGGVLALGTSRGYLVNNTLVGQDAILPYVGQDGILSYVGHPASQRGVGVRVVSATVTLTSANNIIVSHTTGISVVAGARVTTTHDDLWHNDLDFDGVAAGVGNIQQDPLLVDVAKRDYHLRPGSPCIDAGWEPLAAASSASLWTLFPFDFEGHPRVGRMEIGADEVGLGVAKAGPAWANPGTPISYTITISNYHNVTLTEVVVTDALPAGAHLVSVQDGTLWPGDVVMWSVGSIRPTGGTAQVGFVVTATETITNERYRVVTSTQGVSSGIGPAVVTRIEWRLYLPVILRFVDS